MISIKTYMEQKEKGLATVAKTDSEVPTYVVATKKFDPNTGEQLSDEVVGVSLQELVDRKDELEKELLELNTFIKEAELL